jgi:lactate permease
VFTLNWLSASGTSCLFAAITACLFLGVGPGRFLGAYKATFNQLKFPMLTIASMLGLAYVMNYSA